MGHGVTLGAEATRPAELIVVDQGAIVRGMDLDENQVRAGERIASVVREKLLGSGDETLVRIVKALPEESWGRLHAILAEASSKSQSGSA
jgi:hypothetical protein